MKLRFILALLTCLLFACESKMDVTRKQVTGRWQVKEISLKGQLFPPPVIQNYYFVFRSDSTFDIFLGTPDKGKWEVNPEGTILKTYSEFNVGNFNEIDIDSLTQDFMVLKNEMGDSPVRFVLQRVKE